VLKEKYAGLKGRGDGRASEEKKELSFEKKPPGNHS